MQFIIAMQIFKCLCIYLISFDMRKYALLDKLDGEGEKYIWGSWTLKRIS